MESINLDHIKGPEFSLEVYKDCAIIKGWIDVDAFQLLVQVCRDHGFTHLKPMENGGRGFKLIKKETI